MERQPSTEAPLDSSLLPGVRWDLQRVQHARFTQEERLRLALMAHFLSACSRQHFESCGENELWHVLLTLPELKRQLCHLSRGKSARSAELSARRRIKYTEITPAQPSLSARTCRTNPALTIQLIFVIFLQPIN